MQNAKEGQGDEQSNIKGNVRNSPPVDRMSTKDRMMGRASEMARGQKLTSCRRNAKAMAG
jgi:hypothetical protein